MIPRLVVIISCFACTLLLCLQSACSDAEEVPIIRDNPALSDETRIVSLSPAISSTLYDLGCGDQIVGATQFCTHPKELTRAKEEGRVANVGGLTNPAIETILKLRPTFIFAEKTTHSSKLDRLRERGIRLIEIKLESFEDIKGMVFTLGRHLQRKDEAAEIVAQIDAAIGEKIGQPVPRVLMVYYSETPASVDAIGPRSYQVQILEQLGATIALEESNIVTPRLNIEQILKLDPDMIIEIHYAGKVKPPLERWKMVDHLRAVKLEEVHGIGGKENVLPASCVVGFIGRIRAMLEAWQERERKR